MSSKWRYFYFCFNNLFMEQVMLQMMPRRFTTIFYLPCCIIDRLIKMKKSKDIIHQRKVVVVGAGAVGATYCYALAQSGLADEIVLLDRNEKLVKGQVMDLVHGQPFFPTVGNRCRRLGSPKLGPGLRAVLESQGHRGRDLGRR